MDENSELTHQQTNDPTNQQNKQPVEVIASPKNSLTPKEFQASWVDPKSIDKP